MSACDIAVLGAGLSGVLAAGWLRVRYPNERVVIIEPGEPGAAFWSGGLKYLRPSQDFTDYLLEIGLPFDIHAVRGGVWMDGKILRYPLDDRYAQDLVQREHYVKTRGTIEGYTTDVMNFGGKDQVRYTLDYRALVSASIRHRNHKIIQAHVKGIKLLSNRASEIITSDGEVVYARNVVSTLPLPLYLTLSDVPMEKRPTLAHRWLFVYHAEGDPEALGDRDYVYTPQLPNVHRVSKTTTAGMYHVEVNRAGRGQSPTDNIHQEVEPLLKNAVPSGSYLAPVTILPGHILPSDMAGWHPPSSHILLGRYAAWEPRSTADRTFQVMKERVCW